MNTSGSGPNCGPFASSSYNMPISVVCVHFIAGLYIPLFLLLFVRRRHLPSVRQTNPARVVVISTFGGIYCLGAPGALLVYDVWPISIGAYALVTTASFLWTMFAAFSSDVVLVCTYFQSKWTVDMHANMQSSVPSHHLVARCKLLQRVLAPRPLLALSIVLHILWTLPYLLHILLSAESSFWRIETSWSAPLAADLVHVTVLQCAFLLAGTTFLGYLLGSINEAFALRRVYVSAARGIAACFIGYLVAALVVPSTKETLRTTLATSITHMAVHVVVLPLLVRPVLRSRHEAVLALSSAHFRDKESWEAINAELLALFLATPDGAATYLAFTQVQLLPVAWLLAYRDIKSRVATPQALYDAYLQTGSVLCMRAFVPEAIRDELDMTFARNVLASKSDDLYVMYDPLVTRLLQALVLHTLPQLLDHPLGHVWHAFVETYGGQFSGDDLLLNGAGYLGPFGVRRPLGTIHSQATYVSSRFSSRRQSRYTSSRVSMAN